MSEKVKIGVFGAARGKCMIDVLEYHPEADLVAVCDGILKIPPIV